MTTLIEADMCCNFRRVGVGTSKQLQLAGSAIGLLLALGLTTAAAAQTVAGDQAAGASPADSNASTAAKRGAQKSTGASTTVGEIVVTATGTNIRGVKPVGSEAVVLTRTQILSTGDTNLDDVLQTLPQVQNNPNGAGGVVYRQGGTSAYGGDPTQGTAINLRGIGTAATLTLVDGHRLAPSGASNTFTEAIQVPIAALQAVEVVADGNSAIYGSDAVSGVVNYILRKDFNGLEITGRDTFTRYYNEWGASITAGHTWDSLGSMGRGNFILTFDYDYRGHMLEGASPFLRQDLAPLGGVDNRANNGAVTPGNPGDIVVTIAGPTGNTYQYYGLPTGANTHLTFADLSSSPNEVDAADYNDYLGQQTREQVAGFFNQEINSWLSVSYEGFYTHRLTVSHSYENTANDAPITLCQSSPFFISGIPGLTPNAACGGQLSESFAYDAYKDFGSYLTTNPDTTYTNTFGLTAQLPRDWKADGYFTYGKDSTCGICNIGDNINYSALAADANAGLINPLSSTPMTAAQKASIIGTNSQNASNVLEDAVLKFDGSLFDLPGGKVRAAVGGEFSHNEQSLTNVSNTNNPNPTDDTSNVTNSTTVSRNIASVFGELYVPIVGADNAMPLVKSFNLDGAVRYDHYSDFGGTTNPKFGVTWQVDNDLTLRGSWGTSFRAPALTDTNPLNFSAALYGLPVANNSGNPNIANVFPGFTSVYLLVGANPNLKPETADTWSVGFDYRPHWLSGLRASATYYNIAYTNQIVSPNTGEFLASPQNAQIYARYLTPVHNPANCNANDPSTLDPGLAAFIAQNPALYKPIIFGACSVDVIIDGREANAASTFQDGLDLDLNYTFKTGMGVWNVGGNVTKILDDKQTLVNGVPQQSVLDTLYYPVSLRGRGNVGWASGSWSANLFVNYVGSYLNNVPLQGRPNQTVPAWVTLDASIGFQVPKDAPMKLLRGVRASLSIQNLTDRDPPLVLTSTFQGFDPSNANVFGRMATLQLTKAF